MLAFPSLVRSLGLPERISSISRQVMHAIASPEPDLCTDVVPLFPSRVCSFPFVVCCPVFVQLKAHSSGRYFLHQATTATTTSGFRRTRGRKSAAPAEPVKTVAYIQTNQAILRCSRTNHDKCIRSVSARSRVEKYSFFPRAVNTCSALPSEAVNKIQILINFVQQVTEPV